MTETTKKKQVRTRRNGPNPGNAQPNPKDGETQQMEAVIVPIDTYADIIEALGDLPRNDTKMLFKAIARLNPQMVNFTGTPG